MQIDARFLRIGQYVKLVCEAPEWWIRSRSSLFFSSFFCRCGMWFRYRDNGIALCNSLFMGERGTRDLQFDLYGCCYLLARKVNRVNGAWMVQRLKSVRTCG